MSILLDILNVLFRAPLVFIFVAGIVLVILAIIGIIPLPTTLKLTRWQSIAIAVIGVMLIVSSVITAAYSLNPNPLTNGSPTLAPTSTLTPTLSPTPISSPSPTAYPPPGWTSVLNDSLKISSSIWQQGRSSDGNSSCTFTADGYQVNASKPNSGYACFLYASDYTNFAFAVQMTIVNGAQGGLVFRADTTGNAYYFRLNRGRTYGLDIYKNYQPSRTIRSGTSTAIHMGLNQLNVIAVLAEGDIITLYVNDQQIALVDDGTYHQGRIGLIADTDQSPPTTVLYSNADVWMPS